MTAFDWIAAAFVVVTMIYLSFFLTLREWFAALRRPSSASTAKSVGQANSWTAPPRARACRSRPAPVRHGILVGTLALVLLSPGAVWLGQHSGLTWIQVAVSEQPASASFSERVETEHLPGPIHVERRPSGSLDIEPWSATEPPRKAWTESGDLSPGNCAAGPWSYPEYPCQKAAYPWNCSPDHSRSVTSCVSPS